MKDIRPYKKQLRQQTKDFRRSLVGTVKEKKDRSILDRLMGLYQYQQADTLLCYVSTPIEVNTHGLIEQALAEGKRVAVPRCIEGTHNMDFYYIRSFDDLEKRTFGVLEPKLPQCPKVTDFQGSICVVPALLYDLKGFRLGYGAGYYDRFLSVYNGFKVGIIYGECVRPHLQHGRYDVPVDLLVTENYIRLTKKDHKKGPSKKTKAAKSGGKRQEEGKAAAGPHTEPAAQPNSAPANGTSRDGTAPDSPRKKRRRRRSKKGKKSVATAQEQTPTAG